jgi:hypothetical protein
MDWSYEDELADQRYDARCYAADCEESEKGECQHCNGTGEGRSSESSCSICGGRGEC